MGSRPDGIWNKLLSRGYGALWAAFVGFSGLALGVYNKMLDQTSEWGFHQVSGLEIFFADLSLVMAVFVLVVIIVKFASSLR